MTHRHRTAARFARRLALLAVPILPLACGSTAPDATSPDLRPSPSGSGSLAGTEWILMEIGGEPPIGEGRITLVVDEESAGGWSGCNHWGGTPVVTDETIRVNDIVATAMACEDSQETMSNAAACRPTTRTMAAAFSTSPVHRASSRRPSQHATRWSARVTRRNAHGREPRAAISSVISALGKSRT